MMTMRRVTRVTGTIVLESALHVGTGRPGRAASDHGVLLDPDGRPVIPGSSLKGVLRSTAESLAGHLGMKACFLAGEAGCATGNTSREKDLRDRLEAAGPSEVASILAEAFCDVCLLFGSPLVASRVRLVDASTDWKGMPEVRDGVSLDRDSRTARPGLKFDFEVIPAGVSFAFELRATNLGRRERALLWAALREWSRGFALGGKVSRGLGAARLEDLSWREADLEDPAQRVAYLARSTMQEVPGETLDRELEEILGGGESDA